MNTEDYYSFPPTEKSDITNIILLLSFLLGGTQLCSIEIFYEFMPQRTILLLIFLCVISYHIPTIIINASSSTHRKTYYALLKTISGNLAGYSIIVYFTLIQIIQVVIFQVLLEKHIEQFIKFVDKSLSYNYGPWATVLCLMIIVIQSRQENLKSLWPYALVSIIFAFYALFASIIMIANNSEVPKYINRTQAELENSVNYSIFKDFSYFSIFFMQSYHALLKIVKSPSAFTMKKTAFWGFGSAFFIYALIGTLGKIAYLYRPAYDSDYYIFGNNYFLFQQNSIVQFIGLVLQILYMASEMMLFISYFMRFISKEILRNYWLGRYERKYIIKILIFFCIIIGSMIIKNSSYVEKIFSIFSLILIECLFIIFAECALFLEYKWSVSIILGFILWIIMLFSGVHAWQIIIYR